MLCSIQILLPTDKFHFQLYDILALVMLLTTSCLWLFGLFSILGASPPNHALFVFPFFSLFFSFEFYNLAISEVFFSISPSKVDGYHVLLEL
jgi:hypothetical protein